MTKDLDRANEIVAGRQDGLLQDSDSGLGRWLSSRIDAREAAREAAQMAFAQRQPAVPEHQLRVVAERQLLEQDIAKLGAFLSSAASAQLSLIEAQLMARQHGHMMGYSATLLQRLRLWGLA